jgi:ABC-type transport system involved in multi-copper enzyme maturation permease subunit
MENDVLATLLNRIFFAFAVIAVTLALTSDAFASESERATLPLVLARSTPRWAWFLGRRLACDLVALGLAVPAAIALFAITCGGSSDHWLAYTTLAATVLGVLAYDSVFALIALAPRAALAIGLVFGFVWELALAEVSERVRVLVVAFHLRSFVLRAVLEEPGGYYQSFDSAWGAAAVLVAVIVVTTALGAVLFGRRDAGTAVA